MIAFNEDLGIIRAQQANLTAYGENLPGQMDFNQDAGGIQARHIVDAILAAENAAPPLRACG